MLGNLHKDKVIRKKKKQGGEANGPSKKANRTDCKGGGGRKK